MRNFGVTGGALRVSYLSDVIRKNQENPPYGQVRQVTLDFARFCLRKCI
jgi:hypothetical protein